MRENLLPGIELVNGDCAAVLPELPPADLILTSPPYDNAGSCADTTMPGFAGVGYRRLGVRHGDHMPALGRQAGGGGGQ